MLIKRNINYNTLRLIVFERKQNMARGISTAQLAAVVIIVFVSTCMYTVYIRSYYIGTCTHCTCTYIYCIYSYYIHMLCYVAALFE